MYKFQFLNRRCRMRPVWPFVVAVFGCIVSAKTPAQGVPAAAPESGGAASAATNPAPTYLRDIQPLFMANCAQCHNEQSRFVYDWLDYHTISL